MTVLLVILLVVYAAVLSAPISTRLVGLILARNGLRELPLPRAIDDGPFGDTEKRHQCSPQWPRRNSHGIVRNQDARIQGGKS